MNLDHIRTICRRIFWQADTQILHLILASASLLWAISLPLLIPPPATPPFRLMWEAASPQAWAVLFALHVVGMNFCLFCKSDVPRCKTIVQFYGAILWISTTLIMNVSVGRFTPSSALEVVMCGFIVWSIFRAGVKK